MDETRMVSYVCEHVDKSFVAALETAFPLDRLFLQLPHLLGHLQDNKKKDSSI